MKTVTRLTLLGWIGAFLFVAPTPMAIIIADRAIPSIGEIEDAARYAEAFNRVESRSARPSTFLSDYTLPLPVLTVLTTLTLVGAVLLLVGRETITKHS